MQTHWQGSSLWLDLASLVQQCDSSSYARALELYRMGLGKTLQTLAHIEIEKDAGRLTLPALVIAPVRLMGKARNATT